MAQIFSRASDTYLRAAAIAVGLIVAGGLALAGGLVRSEYLTGENFRAAQPVPFSHRHHAGQLGIDCRYCHDSVETAASAGYPPTYTCMSCHSQLWTNAAALAPVRESLATNTPIHWNRVYDMPDYVYFHHGIHIQKGVPCEHCHGRVDQMERVYKATPMTMGWCLECHRNPAPYLRPKDAVFDFGWHPPKNREELRQRLVAELGIEPAKLDSCYVCHR